MLFPFLMYFVLTKFSFISLRAYNLGYGRILENQNLTVCQLTTINSIFFILFPNRDWHFPNSRNHYIMWFAFTEAKDEISTVVALQCTTFFVPFSCSDFFFFLSQIWNMLIINIPYNTKNIKRVVFHRLLSHLHGWGFRLGLLKSNEGSLLLGT